ncbi:helix-turn-helix domain-containing protein [uncultured Eubacterium sp.]|uniref:helix-turn-helix domain-containing protein n=1 Tax=uncultured Eubacterium sp. TaxID=165185 RepID=UPI0025D5F92F|nr:helix-turn-helix transcriptional regulator [uncultured Eubacterium sp.]
MSNKVFMKEVGRRLKKRRKELDYTQVQLVEILNKNNPESTGDFLSDKLISRVESGHNCTKIDKFVKWCLALGKTPDYFLLGIDNGLEVKDNKIDQICGYLKLCTDEDVDNTLIFVKAMFDKNKK